MKIILFIASLMLSSIVLSQDDTLSDFSLDLEKEIGFSQKRILEISNSIRLKFKKMEFLENAQYNSFINTLYLNKVMKKDKKLMSIEDMKTKFLYDYKIKVAAIFRELGNAEYDIFIEDEDGDEESKLFQILATDVRSWFVRNYPKIDDDLAIRNLFLSFRTELIEKFFLDYDKILLANGFNVFHKKCFLTSRLASRVRKLSREDFQKLFLPTESTFFKNYIERIRPTFLRVDGISIDLNLNPKDIFSLQWFESLWSYHRSVYNIPTSPSELLKIIENFYPHINSIRDCRNKLWDSVNLPKI